MSLFEKVEDLHALAATAKDANPFNKMAAATAVAEKSLEVIDVLANRVVELENRINNLVKG